MILSKVKSNNVTLLLKNSAMVSTYLLLPYPLNSSLTLIPLYSFCSCHTGHLTISHTFQLHSCLRVFALAIPPDSHSNFHSTQISPSHWGLPWIPYLKIAKFPTQPSISKPPFICSFFLLYHLSLSNIPDNLLIYCWKNFNYIDEMHK